MAPPLDILLVEDSETQAAILSDLLGKNGFRVTTAYHGRQAVEILRTFHPDMVLSDILMPEMDGFELCRHIKSTPGLQDIPVMMLTSLSDPMDVIMALSVGADYFLSKPFDENRLVDQIRSFLSTCSERSRQSPGDPPQVYWKGVCYTISSSRQQIVDLLLSTYENATFKNQELEKVNRELVILKQQLEQDIQKRKQMEDRLVESEQHLQLVLNSIQIGVVVIDPRTGRIMDANRYSLQLIGREKSEILGLPWNDFLEEERPLPPVPHNYIENKEPDQFLKSKDGCNIPILKTVTPIRFHGQIFSLETFVDITDQVQAREEILKAKTAAENANMSKNEFLANTSHELRTPMNGIIGMASLLMDTPLTGEQEEYLRIIRDSAESLLRIMNDILDFSKMEAGKLELDIIDFDLRVTLEETTRLLQTKALEKGLQLRTIIDYEVPSLVSGDPGRLRQVLMNLVGNAIKFTPEGDVLIEVKIEKETEESIQVRFAVTDTGIGIPEDKQHRLFQSFSQVDASTTRKYGGTGLGLAISKQFVELMGGVIGMTSHPGSGSVFWFSVPLRKQPEPEVSQITIPADLKGKHVLIVDGVETSRKILTNMLKKQGCILDDAVDGNEALKKLREHRERGTPFDAVVIDMEAPGIDGKGLGRVIKANSDLTGTVLVMLSSGRRGDALWLQDIGFSAYLTRPIKESQLVECLATALGIPLTNVKKPSKPIVTRYSLSEERKRNTRILLVEDNPINQKIALKMLSKYGYAGETASTGVQALRMMKEAWYDLVLMDVIMPEMDGYETTTHIRDPQFGIMNPGVPVIAMTANVMKGDREKCLAAGMNDYLPKPINPQKLLQVVEHWLSLQLMNHSGSPSSSKPPQKTDSTVA